MIHVNKIAIHEFRGIRKLEIDFKGENFAICGPNGTGKSGIVDALEFALTGNISRLSGEGTGEISVKSHAPHVDSRDFPEKAFVIVEIDIPKLGKQATITRNVSDPSNPIISSKESDVLQILEQVSLHPEFVLSRRELIRYVISTPGDRAKEVQALLRLDEVENLRKILQKIANAFEKERKILKVEKMQAEQQLTFALGITSLNPQTLVEAVNPRRSILGLGSILTLTATTSLRDGLISHESKSRPSGIPKIQALADIKSTKTALGNLTTLEVNEKIKNVISQLDLLSLDPLASVSLEREVFLKSALAYSENGICPVCNTNLGLTELKEIIEHKLLHFDEISKKRLSLEKQISPLLKLLMELKNSLNPIISYERIFGSAIDFTSFRNFKDDLQSKISNIEKLVPFNISIDSLRSISNVPAEVKQTIEEMEKIVNSIPEPTEQDAARDFLTVCQERLEAYRSVSLRHKQAAEKASISKGVFTTYAEISTDALNEIYKNVEKDFSNLYRVINKEDEEKFSAQLTPSIGKLGFDVDFYGKGFFPPGAYHSEGHQDGMGICLYLALMKHLLSDAFTFAVFDDVLMSVDTGHRREICKLLKEQFPNTQFILTTHDQVWLKHMKTAGLINPNSFINFRKWHVDHGPTKWDDRDVWDEINSDLGRSDVRSAASLLRYYLEFILSEICHNLSAPVQFRVDSQYQLGDLLPSALGRLAKILKEAKNSANSWKKTEELKAIEDFEIDFQKKIKDSKIDEWQINPAVHYNEWANFCLEDFKPVVKTFNDLINVFFCIECKSLLYLVPERGEKQELRCKCKFISFNLLEK